MATPNGPLKVGVWNAVHISIVNLTADYTWTVESKS
jgi:hypothetical protein